MISQTISHYRIIEKLGGGGMGIVYKAEDTRLHRFVALKFLPDEVATDPQALVRFQREAKVISSLNHPHICVLYDVGRQDGMDYLVMECVEGETLAKRLEKGPLPLDQALKYGAQIADALDKAHGKGVVHRDLKPGNIMLTPTGAKLLDFGLARIAAPLTGAATLTAAVSQTSPVTQEGAIVGTLQYMSPEQVEGTEIDGRSDIFSLGAVLYEMVSGKRAFEGRSRLSVASAILEKEPAPICTIKPMTPLTLEHAIRRCLSKSPVDRWQSAADLKCELEWIVESGTRSGTLPVPAIRRTKALSLYAGLATMVALALASLLWYESAKPRPASPVVRFTLTFPASEPLAVNNGPALAFAPDGRRIAYVVHRGDTSQIYVRELASFEDKLMLGTEGASQPFFSWDGEWLGFFADGKLKKISVRGGPAVVLCEAPEGIGATWLRDGGIVFNADWREGLRRVPGGGGASTVLTHPDVQRGEAYHWRPEVLPNGEAVLFTDKKGPGRTETSIAVLSLKSGEWNTLIDKGDSPLYLASGHIVYERDGAFLAAPFDLEKLAVTGPSFPVLQGVLFDLDFGGGQIAVSRDGSVAYVPGTTRPLENLLVTVDRSGHETPLSNLHRSYEDLTLSPDGRFLALTMRGEQEWNVWLYDLRHGNLSRVTFEGDNRDPIWSADSKRVAYGSFRNGHYGIFWKPIFGPGPEEKLVETEVTPWPFSFSRDGQWLSYTLENPSIPTAGVFLLPVKGDRQAKRIVSEPSAYGGAISPDGKWLAYESRESGRSEVYVRELPSGPGKWQISSEGGVRPRWSADGHELFFRSGVIAGTSTLMTVPVQTEGAFTAGSPRPLFRFRYEQGGHDYAVMPDGQHFICIKESERESSATQMNVVLNWSAELQRK